METQALSPAEMFADVALQADIPKVKTVDLSEFEALVIKLGEASIVLSTRPEDGRLSVSFSGEVDLEVPEDFNILTSREVNMVGGDGINLDAGKVSRGRIRQGNIHINSGRAKQVRGLGIPGAGK